MNGGASFNIGQAAAQELVACCHGDQRPDCPILDGLGELQPF